MANIKTHLNNIKGALYGKDVRGSIHDGIDAINKEVENTTGRQVDLENTFDQLVINAGNSNAEIVDARVKNDGTSYSKLGDRLDGIDSQLAHNSIKTLSTKLFDSLQETIAKAKEMGISKVFVDRDFDEEISLQSDITLISNGNRIKRIKAQGTRSDFINYSTIGDNYVITSELCEGDLVIIDKPGEYRELNKVLYVDNGKAYFECDFLFDYSSNCRIIKINPVKNITLENIIIDSLDFFYCENVNINKVDFNKNSTILMTYNLSLNNVTVNSIRDIESRLDIFSCSRCININDLILVGGNTESDNSNLKFNQVADLNINNLVLKSAYKPINKYGYNGYFHNFMIDGAISELLYFIGDECSYPIYPSKNININNVTMTGSNNNGHSLFITVVDNVNISNITGCKSISLKHVNNINITNLNTNELLFEGKTTNVNITNSNIYSLHQLNEATNIKFINTIVKEIVGNNNNTSNVKFINCEIYSKMIQDGSSNVKDWSFSNCYIESIRAVGCGDVYITLNNVETKLLWLSGASNIQGKNIIIDNSENSTHWLQNLTNVNIEGILKNSETITINNGGGINYNTDVRINSNTKKYRISYFLINYNDVKIHQENKSFKYKDIVENRDPSHNQPQRWICIDSNGTLIPLDKIGYSFN